MTSIMTFDDKGVITYFISQLLLIGLYIIYSKFFKTKQPSVNFSLSHYLVGLAIGLCSSIVLLNWESFAKQTEYKVDPPDTTEVIVIPTSAQIKPMTKVPPPSPPKIKKTLSKIIEINVVEDLGEQKHEANDESELIADTISTNPIVDVIPPPVAPIVEDENDDPIAIPDQMPRFPGCEDLEMTKTEKAACATESLLNYIYKNLKYPPMARRNGIEGLVVVQFVVNKEGLIDNIKVLKDIGAGCGKASEKVVKSMNKMTYPWTPGLQNGKPLFIVTLVILAV